MNEGTVRKRITLGFAAVMLVMIGLAGFAYSQLRAIAGQAAALSGDSVPGLYLLGRLYSVSLSIHTSIQQLVLERDDTKTRQSLAQIQDKTAELTELLKQYRPTVVTAGEKELEKTFESAFASYMATRSEVIRLGTDVKTKPDAAALLHDKLEPAFAKLEEAIDADLNFNKKNAEDAPELILEAAVRAEHGMIIALLVGFLLGSIAAYLVVQAIDRPLVRLVAAMELMRQGDYSRKVTIQQNGEFGVLAGGLNLVMESLQEMIRRVQTSGLQVNTSSTEIAATAQEQLSTATEVAATTSEIGATSKEISATSKELVETIREITEVAEKTAALAGSGQEGLTRMTATMQKVMEASTSISARLATLSEKAGNIGIVVITITKVADQTNLLSLNAAIEAEKAGDYGRGFAVVATEIRRLADQTAVATGDIEQMVKEMQSAVAAGVMGMDKFSEEVRRGVEVVQQVSSDLSQIIHHVQALTPNFETVSEGMQSQSVGAQQISDSLSQLSEAAQQTVESLRQSNAAIGQLNDASRGLQDGVARFKVQA